MYNGSEDAQSTLPSGRDAEKGREEEKTVANFVTLCALSMGEPDFGGLPKSFSAYEKEIRAHLARAIDGALCHAPDLIVLPECSSRYTLGQSAPPAAELGEYYRYLAGRMEEFLLTVAKKEGVNIAYSAIRYAACGAEHPFRNSTVYLGRSGAVMGTYDKNHLVLNEYEEEGVAYGTAAELVSLDFGSVATAICFDLNFEELLQKYASKRPDLVVFSSMYHGGLQQSHWAYGCRCHFVGAVCGQQSTVLDPCGDVIAASSNYTDSIAARVNLDCCLCHLDHHFGKIAAAKEKYKTALTVKVPSYLGCALLTSNDPDLTVWDIMREFEIRPLDAYLDACRAHRAARI